MIVNGTLPYDSAPGGWRASMAQLDTTQAPYGDIVALHNAHCFIPTVSALDLPTSDLFFDVAGTPVPSRSRPSTRSTGRLRTKSMYISRRRRRSG